MRYLKTLTPFCLLFLLVGILAYELFYAKPHELPSALIGQAVPAFNVPELNHPEQRFTERQFAQHVMLLNVWASWCEACQTEAGMLMKIAKQYHVPLFGLVYKDKPADAKKWLIDNGNPYIAIGDDANGDVAIDLGVYGTPETFVINKQGQIIYRHIGSIDQTAWDKTLYPLIQRAEAGN